MLDSLWIHQQAADRRAAISSLGPREASTSDIGDIAVIRDEGDVIVPANAFDLKGVGLRFTRNSSGGYDVRVSDSAFRTADRQPDHAQRRRHRARRRRLLVSILLRQRAHRVRELGRQHHLPRRGQRQHRPQRRAPADRAAPGGGVPGRSRSERRRHRLRQRRQRSVHRHLVRGPWVRLGARPPPTQTTLLPDGTIEMRFAAGITLPDAVVGLSPGQTLDFRTVDLSAQGPTSGGGTALGERFSPRIRISTSSRVSNTFYRSHPDAFDQLVIWTDTSVVSGNAFAFESTVANEVQGIGLDIFDTSREFGSAGTAAQLHDDGSALEVSRRPDHAVPRREQHAQRARPGSRASLAGATSTSATTPASAPKSCSAAIRPIGASSWTPMRR